MAQHVSVLFPGQGSQYNGMGKDLYNSYARVRKIFEEASSISGYNIQNNIFEKNQHFLSYENLFINILTLQYSSYQVFMDCYNVKPAFLLGHSLGEISALLCSGALSLKDAIEIVRKRGQLMGSKLIPEGKMVAVMGSNTKILNEICEEVHSNYHDIVEVANWNSAEQVIISGSIKAVDLVLEKLRTKKTGIIMELNIHKPFHTKMMEPIKDKFYEFCKKFTYRKCSIPVISNVTARPYEDDRIPEYLSEQLVHAVQWMPSISYIVNEKSDLVVEMPPQNILRNLLLTNEYGLGVYSFDSKLDQKELADILVPISHCTKLSSKARLDFMSHCLVTAISIKNKLELSNVENSEAEKSYKFIQQQMFYHKENELVPSNELMKQTINHLIKILSLKGMNQNEISCEIDELLITTGTFHFFNQIFRRGKDD